MLTVFLAWLVVYPIALVILGSVRSTDGWTLQYLAAFLSDAHEWGALWNSVWLSLASVLLAGAIGIPLAFVFEWLDFPGRRDGICGARGGFPFRNR